MRELGGLSSNDVTHYPGLVEDDAEADADAGADADACWLG